MKSCIILCGGRGRRMGRDKGTLIFNDQPLLLHLLESLPPLDEIILVLRDDKQLQSYQEVLNSYPLEVKVIFDVERDQGPLIGILAGLSLIKASKALVIPCDSPGIRPPFVEYMLAQDLRGCAALVPRWSDGRSEPLHAVYHKNKTLPVVEKLVERGVRDVKSLFHYLPVLYLDAKSLDPQGDTFLNLNRPQDVEELRKRN